MENASKFLLMAGGILIALLVISALVLMFNQIGDYEKGKSNTEKVSQVADFNKEFMVFTYDNIQGTDIISLANKIVNFNSKSGMQNSINYDKKIKLILNFGNKNKSGSFAYKLGGNPVIFTKDDPYIIENSSGFLQLISKYMEYDNKFSIKVMNRLSANYDSIASGEKTIEQITGKDIPITLSEIEKYREYSEFKGSTFKNTKIEYDGEQIKNMYFEFVK